MLLGKKKSVSIPRNTEAKRGGAIDEGLLRDAFAYTDHTLREAVLEERAELGKTAPVGLNFSKKSDDAMDHRGGGGFGTGRGTIASSSSRSSQGHGVTRKGSEGSSSSGGVVQKLRNKTQSLGQKNSSSSSSASANRSGGRDYGGGGDSLSAVFNVSAVDIESEACDKRGTFDMGSLVQNFESGVTLQRLRLELAASKEAMSKSREAIQNISDSYHGGDLSGRRRDSVGSLMRKKNPDIRT